MTRYLLASFAVVSSPSVYADNTAEAEQLYSIGQAAFDAKRYDDAITAWQRSYQLSNEPALLLNVGQAYRLRASPGDCTRATEAYEKFVALDPASEQRALADELIAMLKSCAAADAAAIPTQPSPAAEPSPPTVMELDAGEPLPAGFSGRTKQVVGIAIAGGGVVLLATGIYFGRRAASLGDEVNAACELDCDWGVYGPKDADGRSAETMQYVFLGLGAAAIAGGGVLYWLGSRERSSTRFAVSPRRDGGAITWSGTW